MPDRLWPARPRLFRWLGVSVWVTALCGSFGPGPAAEAQAVSSPAPTFAAAPGSPFFVGGDPFALAIWSGHLATSNPAPGTVSAFSVAGTGGLALAPGSPVPAGASAPGSLAAFAGGVDEEIVAVADPSSNAVSAFSVTGPGPLAPVPGSPVPAGVQAPSAVAGVRGKLIAVGGAGSGAVSLLPLSRTGVSGPIGPPVSTGLSSIAALAVGDFNGDGIPDLAVAGGSGSSPANVSVLLGTAQGGFRVAPGSPFWSGGNSPDAIAVEDYNDDGHLDLAIANAASNTVSVWLGNGDGSFRPAPAGPFASGGARPVALVAADLNGDGLADLATINGDSRSVAVYTGTGSGQFSARPEVSGAIGGPAPSALTTGDVNGDLRPDLIVANRQGQTIQVLLTTSVPQRVRLLKSKLHRNGTVGLVLQAPAAGNVSGTLTGGAPRIRRTIKYGVVNATASKPGPVRALVFPTRRGIRLFHTVRVLHLQSNVSFQRAVPENLSDAVLPRVAASTVRRPVVSRHRHARRLIVHVSRLWRR